MPTAPLPHDIQFVALHDGKVHVVAADTETEPDMPLRRIGDGPQDPIATLLGLTPTRCGRQIPRHGSNGAGSRGGFIRTFNDERLCAACHHTVPEADQPRLFEHPQGPR